MNAKAIMDYVLKLEAQVDTLTKEKETLEDELDEVKYDLEETKHELENLQQDLEDNYTPRSNADLYCISDSDFLVN